MVKAKPSGRPANEFPLRFADSSRAKIALPLALTAPPAHCRVASHRVWPLRSHTLFNQPRKDHPMTNLQTLTIPELEASAEYWLGQYNYENAASRGWNAERSEEANRMWQAALNEIERRKAASKFKRGEHYITEGAQELLSPHDIEALLARHLSCDWGDLEPADKAENDIALDKKLRLFSAYDHKAGGFWNITESDRSATTVLFTFGVLSDGVSNHLPVNHRHVTKVGRSCCFAPLHSPQHGKSGECRMTITDRSPSSQHFLTNLPPSRSSSLRPTSTT